MTTRIPKRPEHSKTDPPADHRFRLPTFHRSGRLPLRWLLMVAVSLSVAACNLFGSDDAPEITEIFGYWRLERIVYDDGKILTAASDQMYWVQFKEDLMEWEGEMFHRVSGGAYCNGSGGLFNYTEEGDIDISFICTRAVCGIATEFCIGMSTAYKYKLHKGKLLIAFKYPTDEVIPNEGTIIFEPFNP